MSKPSKNVTTQESALIELLKMPVLLTWKASDMLWETQDLYCGKPGIVGQRGANFTQQNADFLLCIGSRLDLCQTGYDHANFARKAKKAIVDIDKAEIDKLRTAVDVRVPADAGLFLRELLGALAGVSIPDFSPWLARSKAWQKNYPVVLDAYRQSTGLVNTYFLMDVLSDLLTEDVPRAEGYIGYFRDENKFLLNNNWIDGGLRVTWDLMEFAATRMEHAAARDKMVKSDQERALISLGIVSQVKLKTLEAMKSLSKYRKDAELAENAKEALRIATDVEQAKQRSAGQQLMRIARERALCVWLQSEVDKLADLGEFHASLAELDAAVGSNYPVSKAQEIPPSPGLRSVLGAPVGMVKRAAGLVGGLLPR